MRFVASTGYLGFASFPVLLAFWVFVGYRVRVERGRVHESPLAVLARAIRRFEAALRVALLPIVRHVTEQMKGWNVAAEARLSAARRSLPTEGGTTE